MTLQERIAELVEEEVRFRVNKFAHVISKRHDISLKLLLRDVDLVFDSSCSPSTSNQCKGPVPLPMFSLRLLT